MRALLAILALVVVLAAGLFVFAARATGPVIDLVEPKALVGQAGTLDVVVTTPRGRLDDLTVVVEQGQQRFPVFVLTGAEAAGLRQEAEDRVRLTQPLGSRTVKGLTSGPARVVITAARPVLFGLRSARTEVTRDVTVRLEPPRVAVLSSFHFINHGGSEMVVYRATPPDVESGVRVGDRTYPGFPAAGAGIAGADPSLKVAFFALLWDQDLNAPITVYARDEGGNQARAALDSRIFPKPFRKSRIEVADTFLQRVVPAILAETPSLKVEDPNDLVKSFLAINGGLRRTNAEAIAALARKTAPTILWQGAFQQLSNSQVESSFADQRTYFHNGAEIDRQVHLGFDLAVTANVPVAAANRGTVVLAEYLGIYGNTVVVDHGMGVQSLYAHLSSFDVKVGDTVEKGQAVGRSGMTGLAGGDHLHFTMLVGGYPVNPVDWWSSQWIEDRVLRKIREAGGNPTAAAPAPAPPGVPPPTAAR